jgi:hypothetical protein
MINDFGKVIILKYLILDDDILLRNCLEETFYYNENKLLPVYKFGLTKGIPTDKVADILINGCSDPSKIATLVPMAVEKNVVFIDHSFRPLRRCQVR